MGWVRLGCGLCQDDTFGIWDRLIQSVTIHAINEINDGVIVIWLWLSICWPKSGYFSVYACRCSRVTFVNIDLIYFLFWFFSSIFFLLVICKFEIVVCFIYDDLFRLNKIRFSKPSSFIHLNQMFVCNFVLLLSLRSINELNVNNEPKSCESNSTF